MLEDRLHVYYNEHPKTKQRAFVLATQHTADLADLREELDTTNEALEVAKSKESSSSTGECLGCSPFGVADFFVCLCVS